jgi:hypothetical protein
MDLTDINSMTNLMAYRLVAMPSKTMNVLSTGDLEALADMDLDMGCKLSVSPTPDQT